MLGRARIPLAWLILSERRPRLLLALGRIAFAVLLMFSQLGFLNGVFDSQTRLFDYLDADLFVVSQSRYTVVINQRFPRRRLYHALDVPGVREAVPLYIEGMSASLRDPANGRQARLRVLAFNPKDAVFRLPVVQRHARDLLREDVALIDARSREFFPDVQPGTLSELNGRRVTIIERFDLGACFYFEGNLITSDFNYFRYFPRSDPGEVDLGLLRLAHGVDAAAAASSLAAALPGDVGIYTRAEMNRRERDYWANGTATGAVFSLGLAVGFLVGILTCYQILFTDVSDNLPRFATLKAIGYPNRYVVKVVCWEAIYLALLGFVPGLVVSLGLYYVLEEVTLIQLRLTAGRVALVGILTLVMCLAAGLLAVRKALKADPAELF